VLLPASRRRPRCPSRKSWNTAPTRTVICSWSYAATSVATGQPSTRERGSYWYFQFHEGGKRKKLYLGKTGDPESTLAAKRSKPLGE
jgi:hypothetical protein